MRPLYVFLLIFITSCISIDSNLYQIDSVDGVVYLMSVATNYAEDYLDAPYIWRQIKNNDLEIIGTSNIEKYSLNFELSK